MKKTINDFIINILHFACNNDQNTTTRSSEIIKIVLDNGTPEYFFNNIIAKVYLLPASSGFCCQFKFTAKDLSNLPRTKRLI